MPPQLSSSSTDTPSRPTGGRHDDERFLRAAGAEDDGRTGSEGRGGHVPHDGLHPVRESVDSGGRGRAVRGGRGGHRGGGRRVLPADGARRELSARAGAGHGAERGDRVSGRRGRRLVADGDGPGRARRPGRAAARHRRPARSGDARDSARPAPRHRRRHRPLHRLHRRRQREAGDRAGRHGPHAGEESRRDAAARHAWRARIGGARDRAVRPDRHRLPAVSPRRRRDHPGDCRGHGGRDRHRLRVAAGGRVGRTCRGSTRCSRPTSRAR